MAKPCASSSTARSKPISGSSSTIRMRGLSASGIAAAACDALDRAGEVPLQSGRWEQDVDGAVQAEAHHVGDDLAAETIPRRRYDPWAVPFDPVHAEAAAVARPVDIDLAVII